MEDTDNQITPPPPPARYRWRLKPAHTVTLIALALGYPLIPFGWWLALVIACVVIHLTLTIGHWYEIAETLWEENIDLTVQRDVAERKNERLEDELAAMRRALKVVDVPVIRSGEIPQQRRGES